MVQYMAGIYFSLGQSPSKFVRSYKGQWVKLHWSTAEVLVGLFYTKEKHLTNIQTHNNQNSYVGWNTDGWTNIRWPDDSVIHWPKTLGQRSTKNGNNQKVCFRSKLLRVKPTKSFANIFLRRLAKPTFNFFHWQTDRGGV